MKLSRTALLTVFTGFLTVASLAISTIPKVSGGVQFALTVFATTLPFFVLWALVRASHPNVVRARRDAELVELQKKPGPRLSIRASTARKRPRTAIKTKQPLREKSGSPG